MASITLTGTLLDPTGEVAVGDQIRFTHRTTTGETIQNARSIIIIPPTGLYNFPLEFGLIFVEYLDVKDVNYKNLGVVTVNGDTTATDLPALLNSIVPPTDAQLLLFQAILQDTEDARDIALAAAAQQTTLELIFSTVIHPAGTVLTLSGYTLSGDGGGAQWKLNGVVGQPVSKSPAQLGDALLNDASGNQWRAAPLNGIITTRGLGDTQDGSTDDSPAINAGLIGAAGVAKLVSLRGASKCFSKLFVPSNTEWELHQDAVVIKAFDAGSGGAGALVRNVDFSGGNTEIVITGGEFKLDPILGNFRIWGFEKVDDLNVTNNKLRDAKADWSFSTKNCTKVRVNNIDIKTDASIFQDGYHILGGNDIEINGGVIETGDDCISISDRLSFDGGDAFNIRINGPLLKPLANGSGIRLLIADDSIRNIYDISGWAQIVSSASNCIHFDNEDLTTKRIRDIDLSFIIDAANCNDSSVLLRELKDVQINADIRDSFSQAYRCEGNENVKLRGTVSGNRDGSSSLVSLRSGSDYDIDLNVSDAGGSLVSVGSVSEVTGGIIRGIYRGAGGAGIGLTSASGIDISCTVSGAVNPLTEAGTSDNNSIHNCDFRGNTSNSVIIVGAATRVRDNNGFVTHSFGSGTVLDTTTSIQITHGLDNSGGSYNVDVQPTNFGASSRVFVTSRNSTTFTVNVNADPGASGMTFLWKAKNANAF